MVIEHHFTGKSLGRASGEDHRARLACRTPCQLDARDCCLQATQNSETWAQSALRKMESIGRAGNIAHIFRLASAKHTELGQCA